ncbi:MAG: ribonuclease HI family protein [Candidatus Gracilibacteria bacterium]|nr:ribonuclease HI family protein [Candidatus Gracilibacteria bacterium]MDD4530673.1 ribonuclease HI family protein [Candidatus Gracilibacteria bacterium]
MKLKVYTDGGARGNPGSAGLGVYITDEKGNPVEKRYKSLGVMTNNQAEYSGAFFGVKRAIELGATEIELFMDSELVIKQLKGEYKTKNLDLKKIQQELGEILSFWKGKIDFTHIPRTKNKEADRLSNIAMDGNS